ncbi:hypothetical protein [Vibrio cholerae]|uniref:hypothetical protein n=1 Tax=Vibrio cholerae TaxID=666 RepID=UPI000663DDE9|nr:hypothetical protein [Vibrio cholerae]EJL6353843.1 hypothetical protein [Vibrio cholerae]CSB18017.1 Uncharacterised protein [Vibrio cholerae]CSD68190.1 Uncharacterised protein [Vibrio cholerae]HAS3361923.1 hypothetical protein [Vibrio cholerae]
MSSKILSKIQNDIIGLGMSLMAETRTNDVTKLVVCLSGLNIPRATIANIVKAETGTVVSVNRITKIRSAYSGIVKTLSEETDRLYQFHDIA